MSVRCLFKLLSRGSLSGVQLSVCVSECVFACVCGVSGSPRSPVSWEPLQPLDGGRPGVAVLSGVVIALMVC